MLIAGLLQISIKTYLKLYFFSWNVIKGTHLLQDVPYFRVYVGLLHYFMDFLNEKEQN